ncbi:MAG: FAD-binding oxidoreductase [Chloroflexi bacterium]|nr:FAD-binding oxidoreductase [Chloroflexota bacterium]
MKHAEKTPSSSSVPDFLADQISQFRRRFRGDVILPDDSDYEGARRIHNTLFQRYPVVIVRPHDADDVSAAVRFAVQQDLPLAVRGGSHNNGGFATIDDGMVIDLSRMRGITVDAQAHVARAQGGITAGEFTAATSAYGLATPFGDSPTVGVGGITLGGGIGWLTRKYGMTIDSLLAAEVVKADGRVLRASATEHPDLFWALRGGGGNFGVVTTFEFRLYPVETVIGGMLMLPATREVIRGVIDLSVRAPEELGIISAVMRASPMFGLPESMAGMPVVMVLPVWVGDVEAGQRALDPFRKLAEPLADMTQPMPYRAIYEAEGGDIPEHYTSVARNFLADSLDDAAIEAILAHLAADRVPSQSAMTAVQIRPLGGAMARVPTDATAFAHRNANLLVVAAAAMFDPSEYDAHRDWVEGLYQAMRPGATGAYLNFLEIEGEARLREVYPDKTYQRLAEVKRKYDPDNVFRHNQNIAPAGAAR